MLRKGVNITENANSSRGNTGYSQKNGAVSKVNKKLFITLHG
jgi:hypothetical protein